MRAAELSAVALLLFIGTAQADDRGHRLFTGQAPEARPPCHSCHMRDGRGGTEGSAPDLVTAMARHDAGTLRRTLVEGVAPDGRKLSRLMPRYPSVDDGTASALLDYIRALPVRDRRGIDASVIRLGVEADPPYARDLENAFDRLAPRFFGRHIELVPVGPQPTTGAPKVFAVVGTRGPLQPWTDAGVPVLFPRQTLAGTEDPSIVRGLSAAGDDIGDAIMADARRAGLEGVTILGEVDPAIAAVLRPPKDAPAALVIGGNADQLPASARIYAMPGATTAHPGAIRVIPGTPLLERMMSRNIPAAAAHAETAADIIAAVLREVGRDLTRTRFMSAMIRTDLTALGLDYRRAPLTGTRAVVLEAE